MDTVVLRHGHIMNEERYEKNGASQCPVCSKKFSLLFRKHNCRVCGGLHCSNCAPKIAVLEGSDDDLLRVCKACVIKITKEEHEEAGLEREKLRKVKEVLKAKAEGVEAKKDTPEVTADSNAVMQLQQKMRMQEQVQKNPKERSNKKDTDLVLEPLPEDWTAREYRVLCISESRWAPDDSVTKCPACSNEFTNQLRRHHCRACGKVYCSPCAPFVGLATDEARMGETGDSVRMCGRCVQKSIARQKKATAAENEKKARVLAEKLAS